MKWTDSQSAEQKSQASKNLAKVKENEREMLAKGYIMFPVPIKFGVAIEWLTPQQAQEKIDNGAQVPTGVKINVKKALKLLLSSD